MQRLAEGRRMGGLDRVLGIGSMSDGGMGEEHKRNRGELAASMHFWLVLHVSAREVCCCTQTGLM